LDAALASSITDRLDVSTLPSLVERMGLTQTVSLALPFLFTEAVLPAELLATCRDAIKQRQNVIHSGQRGVKPEALQKHLDALRRLTELLLRHSADTE
jgi:hypothetical protein